MKIYISGKISGLHEDDFYSNFGIASDELYKLYPNADVISPLGITQFSGIKCWVCYMITDLYYLRKCTHIAMQKNWIDSKGAWLEYGVAKWIYKLDVIWL